MLSELKKNIFSDTPPLTTEEQAVLVAINPENELLYRNTKPARVDTPDLLDDPELNNNVDPMVSVGLEIP